MGDGTRKRAARSTRPDLGEALTVQCIPRVKQALVDAFAAAGRVELDLGGVTEVDLTGLQLLCAAHRWAGEHAVELAIVGDAPALREAARRGGFTRRKGCGTGCLWSEGEV